VRSPLDTRKRFIIIIIFLMAQGDITTRFEVAGETIILYQNLNSMNCGTSVWDASVVLANYISFNPQFSLGRLQGKRILELGSGCGLLGISLAKRGAHVELTDKPSVLPILRRNVELNIRERVHGINEGEILHGTARVSTLEWGNNLEEMSIQLGAPFDIIVASDCIYSNSSIMPFIGTLVAMSNTNTTILISNELRDESVQQELVEKLRSFFRVKKVSPKKLRVTPPLDVIEVFECKKNGR